MPGTDLHGRADIVGQMRMMTAHTPQPLDEDGLDGGLTGPVEQQFRRHHHFELRPMSRLWPSVRPDPATILGEAETALVVASHDLRQLVAGQRETRPTTRTEQLVDIHPTTRVDPQPQPLRTMPQVLRQVLTHLHQPLIIHAALRLDFSMSVRVSREGEHRTERRRVSTVIRRTEPTRPRQ
jgi:hypothetical protein